MLNKCCIGLILVICIFHPTESQSKYCSSKLCNGKKHIACHNNGKFGAACTASAQMVGLTSRLRRAILNKHNGYRNLIASGGLRRFRPAARMATMRWSEELAKLAAFKVKQCATKHDKCRNTFQFRYAGQNLAMSGWGGKERTVLDVALEHIQMWFSEHKKAIMSEINRLPARKLKTIGHFTAMMQEKSTHIGCAILRQRRKGLINQFMACNYAYTNVVEQPVYRKGRVGSRCRRGRNRRYPALCSLQEKYKVNQLGY